MINSSGGPVVKSGVVDVLNGVLILSISSNCNETIQKKREKK